MSLYLSSMCWAQTWSIVGHTVAMIDPLPHSLLHSYVLTAGDDTFLGAYWMAPPFLSYMPFSTPWQPLHHTRNPKWEVMDFWNPRALYDTFLSCLGHGQPCP
jgi:hypothetical protein